MRRHPLFPIGWLIAASFLLSLVGLTAESLPAFAVDIDEVAASGENDDRR